MRTRSKPQGRHDWPKTTSSRRCCRALRMRAWPLLPRQRSQAPSQASGKTWVSVAQEGRVKALEAEVMQLRSLLGARQIPGSKSTGPSTELHRPRGASFKTVLCRYHQMGRCSKGSACSYAHGAGELQSTSQRKFDIDSPAAASQLQNRAL